MANPEEVISYEEFRGLVNKVKGSRHHKIKNSYGVYDGYKFYRKTKPKEPKYIKWKKKKYLKSTIIEM